MKANGDDADIYHLPQVDYSERGRVIEVSVQGRMVAQTVIYSSVDYRGEKWYYTQEGHKYIRDSRCERAQQQFVEA